MSTFLFSSVSPSWEVGSFSLSLLHAEIMLREGEYEGYRIMRVEHFKEQTAVGHEFCALYIRKEDDSFEEIVVRIERRPGAPKGASSTAVLTDDSISRLNADFNANNTFYHISTTFCKQSPALTVAALCDICAYIQNAAPYYNLKANKHCFWFCAAFLIRLRVLGYTDPLIEEGREYSKRGCFQSMRVMTEAAVEKDLNAHASHQVPRKLLPVLPFRNPFRSTHGRYGNEWTPSRTFVGHKKIVLSVCFSSDERHIISGSQDHTIRIWHATTGREMRPPLKGHTDDVNLVAISPDGCRIASASDDKTVRIRDLETGVPVTEPLRGHTKSVRSVAFSPDGRKVVSGSDDWSVRIWDVETGAAVGEPLRGHSDTVRSVAWSPDGSRIVSGSVDYTIRVWHAKTGTPVGEPLRGHTACVCSVAFSPDGRRLVSGSWDKTVRLWNLSSQRELGEPRLGHTDWVRSVASSPDGRWIASGSDDGTVRIWDSASGGAASEIAKLAAGSEVKSVAWSPAGDRVAGGCSVGKIRTWRKVAS